MKKLPALLLSLLLASAILDARAQEAPAPSPPVSSSPSSSSSGEGKGGLFGDSSEAIDISADGGLEWRRKEHVYIARGNAKAVRGTSVAEADVLSAYYDTTGNNLQRLLAEGHAKLTSGSTLMTGDRGDYDAVMKVLRMTGGDLKVESGDQTITATTAIDYWPDRNVMNALGNSKIVRRDTTINADQSVFYLRKDAQNKSSVYQIESTGHVTIKTPKQTATAKKLVHNIDRDITVLSGNVQITEGDRQIMGERAEIDHKTGVSRLLSSGGGRVHVNIKPKSQPASPPAPGTNPVPTETP